MSVHGLALPEHILADLEYEAEADRHIGRALGVAYLIRDYNPLCDLVWVAENATAPGLIPARWHVKFHDRDKGAMAHYIPWVGPNGEFREPDSSMIEWLQRQDLRRIDVVAEARKAREKRQREIEKKREEASAANVEHFAIFAKSKLNPGVSFNTSRPWTNRVERLPSEPS